MDKRNNNDYNDNNDSDYSSKVPEPYPLPPYVRGVGNYQLNPKPSRLKEKLTRLLFVRHTGTRFENWRDSNQWCRTVYPECRGPVDNRSFDTLRLFYYLNLL